MQTILQNTNTKIGLGALAGVGVIAGTYNYFQGGYATKKALSKDLTGQNIIVTGANAGIGYETVKQLVKQGAHVVLACRSEARATAAMNNIANELGGRSQKAMEFIPLDLSSLKSVHAFSKTIADRRLEIDILINNAGVMHCPHATTVDGLEWQMGVNHFGHFALTMDLLDNIVRNNTKVVNVASLAHTMGTKTLRLEESEYTQACKHISTTELYAQSKLANIMSTKALDRKIRASYPNWKGYVVSLHPGVIRTELMRHYNIAVRIFQNTAAFIFFKSPYAGAQTTLHCALDDSIVGGRYYSDAAEKLPIKYAEDVSIQDKFYALSCKLIKVQDPLQS